MQLPHENKIQNPVSLRSRSDMSTSPSSQRSNLGVDSIEMEHHHIITSPHYLTCTCITLSFDSVPMSPWAALYDPHNFCDAWVRGVVGPGFCPSNSACSWRRTITFTLVRKMSAWSLIIKDTRSDRPVQGWRKVYSVMGHNAY